LTTYAKIVDQFADQYWRLNNLYMIINKNGKSVPFRMNWAQEELFQDLHTRNVILKARQIGFSTFIQILMLDSCVFDSNIQAGVIAHTREDAEAIFKTKVKYAYDRLPEGIRTANPATQDAARHLTFRNGSGIRVGTSLRSGTFQYLHVSEFGKICAKYPEKAEEVITGAFPTVPKNGYIFVESTAEGQEGQFFDICQAAETKQRQRADLTWLDFKFFFYPWQRDPAYTLHQTVDIPAEMAKYFARLASRGIELTEGQKAWYVKTAEPLGDKVRREYPSYSDEAFEASIGGSFYGDLLAKADIQRAGKALHVIDYYANSGEGLEHYAHVLSERQREWSCTYSDHKWPHDGNHRVMDEKGRRKSDIMRGLGFEVTVIERGLVHTGIQATRSLLPRCWFDKERCSEGLKGLRAYRKDWDEKMGTWKKDPRHDWASHPADGFRTGAQAGEVNPEFWGDLGGPRVAVA